MISLTHENGVFLYFCGMKHMISKEGFEKFKAEWEQLKYVERPAMINQVQAAAAEGDRSENAAYTTDACAYAKSTAGCASSTAS